MTTPLVSNYYYDTLVHDLLIEEFNSHINSFKGEPVFLCIGSERHILDCLGPLVGTMVKEKSEEILVYGTLDKPLHAENLVSEIDKIKVLHPEIITIAIDAAIGLEEDIGIIKFRNGPLLPGKALFKRLPPVGDLSITGIVGKKDFNKGRPVFNGSIQHVYYMAQTISNAIYDWYLQYK